ncbi:hypothetical protein KQX54_012828 [Cotesia glomerata]|uniref:Uncharacterized protein n=1 Tax=Cotesia glomerata TaxID=32391 RepID=A0AAV7J3R9_COTGL|nr:hypothetical protein KQX54_012828 [Cotesia glomerata]
MLVQPSNNSRIGVENSWRMGERAGSEYAAVIVLVPRLILSSPPGNLSVAMLGSVGGRHVSTRRRGSSPLVRAGAGLGENHVSLPDGAPRYTRRRRAVTTSDHKSCALIQTRLKLGDIM